jgi:hypothetical protein
MASVSMKTTIQASADKVWEVVSNFGDPGRYIAAITGCEADGEGPGTLRTVTLEGGAEVVERLESLDTQARTLSYSIVDSPLPLRDYVSTMTVRPVGDAACELTWASTFEAEGAPEDEARQIVEGVYALGFEGLKKLLGG